MVKNYNFVINRNAEATNPFYYNERVWMSRINRGPFYESVKVGWILRA